MTLETVRVPDIGELESVDVVEVLVAPGDAVEADESLVSLESDKATMDVPSPRAGRVREVMVKNGDKVVSGDAILTLEIVPEEAAAPEAAAETATVAQAAAEDVAAAEAATAEITVRAVPPGPPPPPPRAGDTVDEGRDLVPLSEAPAADRAYASPAVRRLARELGVDLGAVKGTGRKGRILKEDVKAHVQRALAERRAGRGGGLPEMPVVDFGKFGPVERQALSRIQAISGPNLHRSWLLVPHVTQHDEADVTELEAFRKAHAEEARAAGFRLTPLAFVLKATVAALREFPVVNSSLDADGRHLVLKRYYHLGVAVDTGEGLVVPVLRDVDRKGVFELARELAEVSERARARRLAPADLQGASFTISSLGGIGGTAFTPIVNAPEVAILGLSRHRWQPVWKEGEFVPRLMLPLSLSYDHRVVDGATAVRFTTYLAGLLGDIRRLLL